MFQGETDGLKESLIRDEKHFAGVRKFVGEIVRSYKNNTVKTSTPE